MRCWGRVLCRWTRSKRRSMPGSLLNRPGAWQPAVGSLRRNRALVGLLFALLERLVDQLLGAASKAGWADRRTAVDAILAIGFESDRLVCPGFARLARSALTVAFRDAKPLALRLASANHHLIVGRARAGIGTIDDDLADAAVLRRGGDRNDQCRDGKRKCAGGDGQERQFRHWHSSFIKVKRLGRHPGFPHMRFESSIANRQPARIAVVSSG